jgi:hypothetical protein
MSPFSKTKTKRTDKVVKKRVLRDILLYYALFYGKITVFRLNNKFEVRSVEWLITQ